MQAIECVIFAWSHQHWLYFLHHCHQFLCRSPLSSSLYHVLAYLSLLVDVGMVNRSLEGDTWWFEGEIIEFELYLECSSCVWRSFWSSYEDDPDQVVGLNDVVPICNKMYYFSSSCLSLFNLGALINQQILLLYKISINSLKQSLQSLSYIITYQSYQNHPPSQPYQTHSH